MSETPPPKFVAYPRGDFITSQYGTPERLKTLGDGYFGLTSLAGLNIFLWVFGVIVGVLVASAVLKGVIIVALCTTYYSLCLPVFKSIMGGLGRSDLRAKMLALFTACTTFVLGGLVVCFVLEHFARREMKRYGVRSGWSGITKPQFQAVLDKRRKAEADPIPSFEVPFDGPT